MTAVMVETCRRGHEWTAENTIWRLDGRQRCRTCKLATQAAWRVVHRGEARAKNAARRDQLRAETLEAYGGSCARCGRTGEFGPANDPDALQLDHVQGDGQTERERLNNRGGWLFYQYLRDQGFPGKGTRYQLLCSPCHLAKSAAERRASSDATAS